MAYASYIGSHWELIVLCVLGVAALGYAAFALRNWKVAAFAVVVTCAALFYQRAQIDGYNRRVAEDVAAQTQIYKDRIDALNTLALRNAMQAQKDSDTLNALRKKSEDTPKNDGACLDRAAVGRVRDIR
jgi:hypothetical protein